MTGAVYGLEWLTWSSELLALSIARSISRSPSPLALYASSISRRVGGGGYAHNVITGCDLRDLAAYLVQDTPRGCKKSLHVRGRKTVVVEVRVCGLGLEREMRW